MDDVTDPADVVLSPQDEAKAAVLAEWWSDGATALSDDGWEWLNDEKVTSWLLDHVIDALREMPVEKRMEVMGMKPCAWWIPSLHTKYDSYPGGIIDTDEAPLPERLQRRGGGEDGWPNAAWHLVWVEAEAMEVDRG